MHSRAGAIVEHEEHVLDLLISVVYVALFMEGSARAHCAGDSSFVWFLAALGSLCVLSAPPFDAHVCVSRVLGYEFSQN